VLIFSLAVGGAILRQAAVGWDAGEALSLAVCVLVISLPLALWPSSRGRLFPLGFVLGGWAYLVLSLGPGVDPPRAAYPPAAPLPDFVYDRLYPDAFIRKEAYSRASCVCALCVGPLRERYRRHFFRVGQAGTSILAAASMAAVAYTLSVCLGRLRLRNSTPA